LAIGLLIPAIPRYVTGALHQSTGMVGLSLAITAGAAVLVRPLAGWLTDHAGRRTTTLAGTLLLAATSFALLAADTLPVFLVFRGVAGIGEALAYVGLATAAADTSADDQCPRPAVSHFTVAVNAGLLTGPASAEAVYAAAGHPLVWTVAALAATVAAALALTLTDATRTSPRQSPPIRGRLIHPAGMRPGLGYLASVWGYTAFSAFLPLYLAAHGDASSTTHFAVYGCVLIAVRLGGQRLLITIAPARAATAALILTAAGLILLAAWPTTVVTLCAAAIIGAGQGLALPTFLRMAVTGLPTRERGSAVATTTAFFDIGFLSSALALAALAQAFGLAAGFIVAAAISAAAVLLFLSARHPAPGDHIGPHPCRAE
jgi:predicted MFS family arabinose efflux permease